MRERHGLGATIDRVVLGHALPIVIAVLFLLPLVWMVTGSLREPGQAPPRTIEWLPVPIRPENYGRVFEVLPFGR